VILILFAVAAFLVNYNIGSRTSTTSIANEVAMIKPVFTTTPYFDSSGNTQPGGFYSFYGKYENQTYVTTDLNWLRLNVSRASLSNFGWGTDYNLYLGELANHSELQVITDMEADANGIPSSVGTLILGHEEYVTQREYLHFKQFVASGGNLVLMYGDELEVLVNYSSGIETFVVGHGWAFNGLAASKSNSRYFEQDNENWVASSYYGISPLENGGLGYAEFNALINRTDTTILQLWQVPNLPPDITLAYYIHHYQAGVVTCFCRNWPVTRTTIHKTGTAY